MAAVTGQPGRLTGAVTRWLTEPVPLGRLAAFRTLVYLFVIADLVVFTPWVRAHADVPGELYRPLLIGRLLPLPAPTPALVWGVFAGPVVSAAVAATGRLPRLAGTVVALLYLEWMIIAFSYGKVDHDRFGLLVALAVLATVGRARHGDATRSEAAGWALRATQLAVVATYFLAAFARLRLGRAGVARRRHPRPGRSSPGRPSSPSRCWRCPSAADRRSDRNSRLRAARPAGLRPATPAGGMRAVGFFYSFHLVSFATITI